MNHIDRIMMFMSAYNHLTEIERRYVDGFVTYLSETASRTGQKIIGLAMQPVPGEWSSDLLERPLVVAAIADKIKAIAEQSELSKGRIVRELNNIAFSNMINYWDTGNYGNPTANLDSCTPEQMSAVREIEYDQLVNGAVKIKFKLHDKLKALEMLAKMTGLLEPDNPFMRSETATPTAATVQAGQDAGARYQALLGDD